MKKNVILVCCFAPFLLSACASDDKTPPRRCPQVAILRSVEKFEDYGYDSIDPANLVAVGTMQKVEGQCEYEDNGVHVTFDLVMNAQKGPRLGGDKVSFPYFVSVVKPDETVSGKELMTASFNFDEGTKRAVVSQSLHIFLPLAKNEDASNFRVLTGFQLTEGQMNALREKDSMP